MFKTTIVIWSEFDSFAVELSDLAREAEVGEAYCSVYRGEWVDRPQRDKDWDGTEFFNEEDDEEEG